MTGLTDERALALVALPDGAPDGCGNVTPTHGGRPPRARAGLCRRRELDLLEMGDEHRERALDHLGDIPRGDLVPKQGLRVTQVVMRALAHGELHRERLGRQGFRARAIAPGRRDCSILNYPRL